VIHFSSKNYFCLQLSVWIGLISFLLTPSVLTASLNSPHTVVVAVIDTGLDISHPQLKSWVWENSGEMGLDHNGNPKSSNGIDDDQNGYVDDVHGWDFANSSKNMRDTNGHGTHVAGLVQQGFLEIKKESRNLRIMPLRYTLGTGINSKQSFLAALKYAIDQNVDIINISASGRGFSKTEYDLLKKAGHKGIRVVVATGNKSPGTPDYRSYPASYQLHNILPVSALDQKGRLLPCANQIHKPGVLFAVGEKLRSTLPGNHFGFKTGTSQATALVSGRLAASLLLAVSPEQSTTKALKVVMNPSNTFHN
tara:strand:+ start:8776 stop:9699 length:924 start_codon:yes stop_codon:yes gene_type:complete